MTGYHEFLLFSFYVKGGGWWYSDDCRDAFVGQLTGWNDLTAPTNAKG